MSIVGPRPLAVRYLPYYNDEERKRHSVRPGLTGLAQVNGRNALGWEERFKLDVEYTKNISVVNDIKIILKTVVKVLKKQDIVVRGTGQNMDFDVWRKMKEENKEDEFSK